MIGCVPTTAPGLVFRSHGWVAFSVSKWSTWPHSVHMNRASLLSLSSQIQRISSAESILPLRFKLLIRSRGNVLILVQ